MNNFLKQLMELATKLNEANGFNAVVIIDEMNKLYDKHIAELKDANALTYEERIHIKNTLALMNSMIKSGEQHSVKSNEMLTKSFSILLMEKNIVRRSEQLFCDCEGKISTFQLVSGEICCCKCEKVVAK